MTTQERSFNSKDKLVTGYPEAAIPGRNIGILVALGAFLMIVGNLLHAQPEPGPGNMAAAINAGPLLWRLSHGLISFGAISLAIGALLLLVEGTQLIGRRSANFAWAALGVILPIIVVMTLAELSVFPMAAEAGDLAVIERWEAFTLTGITFSASILFLGFFFIAVDQFQHDDRVTPRWSAGIGSLAAPVGMVGAVIVGIFGLRTLMPLMGLSLLITLAWMLWFGIGVFRSEG